MVTYWCLISICGNGDNCSLNKKETNNIFTWDEWLDNIRSYFNSIHKNRNYNVRFWNFEVLFHRISVKLNTSFCNLSHWIILEPRTYSLYKALNQELTIEIFLKVTQFIFHNYFAILKNNSNILFYNVRHWKRYSQTCIRQPPLRPLKSGRLGQVAVL